MKKVHKWLGILFAVGVMLAGCICQADEIFMPRIEEDFYSYSDYSTAIQYIRSENSNFYTDMDYLVYMTGKQVGDCIQECVEHRDEYLRGTDEQKIADLYRCAMDTEGRNQTGLQPLRPYLQKIQDSKTISEYVDSLLELQNLGAERVLMTCYVIKNGKAEDIGKVALGPGSGMFSPLVPWESEEGEAISQAFLDYAKESFIVMGYDSETAETYAEMVFPVAKGITVHAKSLNVIGESDSLVTKLVNYEEIKEIYSNWNMDDMLEQLGYGTDRQFSVSSMEYAEYMNGLLTEDNLEVMKAYTLLKIVDQYAGVGPLSLHDAKIRFQQIALKGIRIQSQEEEAAGFVKTYLQWQIGNLYARKQVDDQSLQDIENLIDMIRNAYRCMIEEQEWLSQESKAELRQILDDMTVCIAYPQKAETERAVYDVIPLEEGGSLLQNVLNSQIAAYEKKKENPNSKTYMFDSTLTVPSLHYYDIDNSLGINTGVIQTPYYNPKGLLGENLAKIGFLIAREISYAFEQNEQYKSHEEGRDRLFVGDISAIQALMRIAKEEDISSKMILYGYAKLYFEYRRTGEEENKITDQWYSGKRSHVNTVIPNIEELYTNYFIQENDAMYLPPEERFQVWQTTDEKIYIPWRNSNLDGMINRHREQPDVKNDFYTSVNYDWLCDSQIAPGASSQDGWQENQSLIDNELLTLLRNHELNGAAQQIYDIVMDWDTRNEDWKKTMASHIDAIAQIETLDDLTAYLLSEEGMYFGDVFNTFWVDAWGEEDPHYEMDIKVQSLLARYPESYSQEDNTNLVIARKVISHVMNRLGYDSTEIADVLDASIKLEECIARCMFTTEEKSDPEIYQHEMYYYYSLEDLNKYFPHFPIAQMVEAYGYEGWNKYCVEDPYWLHELDNLYMESNVYFFKAYLVAHLIYDNILFADEESVVLYEDIKNKVNGTYGIRDMDEIAYDYIESVCYNELSKAYIERNMTPEKKQDVEDLVKEIIESYKEMISQSQWLSDTAKEKVVKKLDNMKIYAAYVDDYDYEVWDFSWLEDYTDPEQENPVTILSLQEYLKRNDHDFNLHAMTWKPENDTAWIPDMTESNAYYFKSKNAMVIPAAILTDQFFRKDMEKEELLSKLGVVIAHEISHAFDASGSLIDENGEYKEWWTEEDRQIYDEKAAKLVDYFDHLIVMPENTGYSGIQVRNEAIADMTAMQCMLHIAKSIEGFDYDRFFRGYAQLYRSKSKTGITIRTIETDHHPCNFLRVNMIVRQFQEFHDTYQTTEGDRMYQTPEESLCIF